MSEIVVVLVGKTGNGKSSTGNTILQQNAFQESSDMSDGTEFLEVKRTELGGKTLKIYDTPGLMSVTRSEEKIVEELDRFIREVEKVDVFCFVYSYDNRYLHDELDTVKALKKQFGEKFLRNNGIVVVTHGDSCESAANYKRISTEAMFKKWCSTASKEFQELLSEVHGKYLLVNNQGGFSRGPRRDSSDELRAMITKVAMKKSPIRRKNIRK